MADITETTKPISVPKLDFRQLRQAFQGIGVKVTKRSMQSYDYVANTSGWKIDSNGNVEFNDGTFRGILLIGAILGARVQISGNDINMYDDSTGGTNPITGDTASINFIRTDGKNGTFKMQKRAGKNSDSENVMEMFFNEAADDSQRNYLFIGRKGDDSDDNVFTDSVILHGKWDVRAEINSIHEYWKGRPTFYTSDFNKLDNTKQGAFSIISGEGKDGYSALAFSIEAVTFTTPTSFAVGDTITGNVSGATALILYNYGGGIFLCNHTSYGVNFSASDNACTTDGAGGGSGTGAYTDPVPILGGQYLFWPALLVDKSLNVILGSNFIPDTDNAYDVGSSTKQIKDLYIGGTIHGGSNFTVMKKGGGLTISGGAITPTHSFHSIQGEGGAADTLTTIATAGIENGTLLTLQPSDSTIDITLSDETDNLSLAGNCILNNERDTITLILNNNIWYEISRSDNGS